MIRVPKRNDLSRSGEAASGEDRSLVGLGAAVRKEGFAQRPTWGKRRQLLRKPYLGLVRENGGDMLELIDLLVYPGVDLLVAVARR